VLSESIGRVRSGQVGSAFYGTLTITRKIHKRKNGMKEELSATM
jgi:hypothetical protein